MNRLSRAVILVCACLAVMAAGCASTATVDTGASPAAGAPAAASGGTQTGSGKLDAEVAEITSDLTDTEKACIEATPGAAAAADKCVAADKLARQIAKQFLDSPMLTSLKPDERTMVERCLVDALSNADASGLGELATNDDAALRAFSKALGDCVDALKPPLTSVTTARAGVNNTTVELRTPGTAQAARR